MATGGIFQLITNDGKQDAMLMASALLKQRIEEARAARQAQGLADTTPTLYDIERTHILFTNAHFKPFAAIGFEYNKVTTSAGSTTLGSKLVFSIPQFGDFFSDMVVHAVLEQPLLGTTYNNLPIDASRQNLMRWCAYPGERLLKRVRFNVNGNPLDDYTSDAVNYHREFCVQPNKELAWDRCMGQEEPQVGYLDQPNWAANGVPSSAVVSRTRVVDDAGLQTPTGQKVGDVELFIPLLFWCNLDPRLAVPSVAIPYGQRFIEIDLATSQELVGEVPRGADVTDWSAANVAAGGLFSKQASLKTIELYINNIFVNPEVHNIFIKRIGFSLIRVHRLQVNESVGGGAESVLLQNLKWPIEALFVGMRVKDYHNNSADEVLRQHLDKWYKFSTVSTQSRSLKGWCGGKAVVKASGTMAQVFPVMTGGTMTMTVVLNSPVLMVATVDGSLELKVGDVWSFTSAGGLKYSLTVAYVSSDGLTFKFKEVGTTASVADLHGDVVDGAQLATDVSLLSCSSSEQTYKTQVCSPNMLNVTIKAHGIPIYNNFPNGFYNAYIPLAYGGHNIRAPRDCGAMMVTFCLYPGTYQPSGHINVSRAREFYIDFSTANIDSNTSRGTLVIVASAINFLLISDGSAVLRYST
jgi:hypothetical protein